MTWFFVDVGSLALITAFEAVKIIHPVFLFNTTQRSVRVNIDNPARNKRQATTLDVQ
jgi:hypothetical protein